LLCKDALIWPFAFFLSFLFFVFFVIVYYLKTSSSTWKECKNVHRVDLKLMLKSIFVSPDGKPYIMTMKIYLISVSVSDVSLEQAGSELSSRDFISGLAVV